MKKRNVDTDYLRSAVTQLKTLKKDCEQQRDLKMEFEDANEDMGRVHDELIEARRILKEEWETFIFLIDATISFMSEGAHAIDEAEQSSTNSLTGTLG